MTVRLAETAANTVLNPTGPRPGRLAPRPTQQYGRLVHLQVPMRAVFTDDIRPVSDLKVHASAMVDQVVRTGRPMLITRRGRGVAVLFDVEQFERMQEALAFGQAVDEGAAQAERGEFATNAEVEAVLGRRAMGA